MIRGQDCQSMGKLLSIMGHLALIVKLEEEGEKLHMTIYEPRFSVIYEKCAAPSSAEISVVSLPFLFGDIFQSFFMAPTTPLEIGFKGEKGRNKKKS